MKLFILRLLFKNYIDELVYQSEVKGGREFSEYLISLDNKERACSYGDMIECDERTLPNYINWK